MIGERVRDCPVPLLLQRILRGRERIADRFPTWSEHAKPGARDEREQAVVRIDPEVGRREAEPFDLVVRDPRGRPAGGHGALTELRDPRPSRRQQRHLAALPGRADEQRQRADRSEERAVQRGCVENARQPLQQDLERQPHAIVRAAQHGAHSGRNGRHSRRRNDGNTGNIVDSQRPPT